MKNSKKLLLSSACLQAMGGVATVNAGTPPNVVLITTDQHSYNMISALKDAYPNVDCYASTPNIDRLVRNGISFTRTYCANPVSMPSRSAMYSGQMFGNYGVTDNTPNLPIDTVGIRAQLAYSSMGNIFRRYGYEVQYGGKRHLVQSSLTQASTQNAAPPNRYGFPTQIALDEREGLAGTVGSFLKNRTSATPFLVTANFVPPHDICFEQSVGEAVLTPALMATDPEAASMVKLCRDEADSYDANYFLNSLAPTLPTNFAPTNGFIDVKASTVATFSDNYWRRYRWIYKRMVSYADSWIGQILDSIDANPAIKNNTIIIFTADHGEMQGAHSMTVKNAPYEECQRVPFIISGPGIVQNERDNSLLCNGVDLLPTMCELVGIPIPSTYSGVSVAKRARNQGSVTPRDYLYTEGDDFRTVVSADGYKLSKVVSKNTKQLININSDPRETTNIASANPAKVAELDAVITAGFPKLTSIPEITGVSLFADGFETSNGYPANFLAKQTQALGTKSTTLNANPNTNADNWLDAMYVSTKAANTTTNIAVQAVAEERTGGVGAQCLKFTVPNEAFNTGTAYDGKVRIKGKTNKIIFAAGEDLSKYRVTLWARVDGASRPVFKTAKGSQTVSSTWTKYTIETYTTGLSATGLAIDFVHQTDNADYAVYIDDIKVEDMTAPQALLPISTNVTALAAPSASDFAVYPNPASDKVFIKTSDKIETVRVYSLSGFKVLDTQLNSDNSVKLNGLAKGTYIMEANSSKMSYRSKLFIK